ncbi:hypothetical protein D3C72_1822180 [compost metagenome]
MAITWQPMPASARLPSGTLVEVLCGQPAQYQAGREGVATALPSTTSFASRIASRMRMRSLV